jgi:membrane fusion protein, heavy metal efflux system
MPRADIFHHLRRSPRLAVLLASLLIACMASSVAHAAAATADSVQLQPAQVQKLGVQTLRPQPAGDAGRIVLQGQVMLPPQLLRMVSATVAGMVEQVAVSKGDVVKAGQPLMSLHAPELLNWQREFREAGLQLKLAQQTASRDEALLAEGLIPASRAQTSQNQLQMAQAVRNEREQLLRMAGSKADGSLHGRLTLTAPGQGRVLDVLVQPGQRVDAGAPLLKFASAGALSIEGLAPAHLARQLKVGDVVRVEGCEQPARLVSINAQLDNATQMQALRAQWPQANDCALPQQRVQLTVALSPAAQAGQGSARWLVPASAVLSHEGQSIMFVRHGERYDVQLVKIVSASPAPNEAATAANAANWRQIELLKPVRLGAGDEVVVQGTVALKGLLQGLGAP